VSHFQPLHRLTVDMRARRAQRKSAKARPPKASPRGGSRRSPRLGRQEVVMFVALSVVACAMGLLAIRLLDEGAVARPAATIQVPPAAAQPAPPTGEAASTAPAAPVGAREIAPPAAVRPGRPATPKLVPGIWPMEDAANRDEAVRVASVTSVAEVR
jgi:hypothetical protein